MAHGRRTPMRKETAQLTVGWATARRPGIRDLALHMILALATMPSPLDRVLRHGALQVLVTVPLPGVAYPTAEISVISMMLLHQVEITPHQPLVLTVLLLLALLRRHLVDGPTMLPHPAEPSVHPHLEDCPSVEVTMPRLLRPLTHQRLRLAALLLLPARAMEMMTVVLATMMPRQVRKCPLSFFQFLLHTRRNRRKPRPHNTAWIWILDARRIGFTHVLYLKPRCNFLEQPQMTVHLEELLCEQIKR